MKRLRFLHAADLHLDSPFQGLQGLPPHIRDNIRESTFTALTQLTKLAIQEKVDFVVLSGDIYDLSERSLRAQLRFQKALAALAEQHIRVFVIHGNHDPENGRRARLDWPDNVHFFASSNVETVPVYTEDRGLIAYVHGISYAQAAVTDNLALRYRVDDASVFNVAMLHTNVDGDPGHDNYAPCRKADLLQSGMHYWALGHIHTRRIVHADPFIVYSGNLQGRSMKETEAKGCYVVEVEENGQVQLRFHELDTIRWFEDHIDAEALDTEQQLRDALVERIATLRGSLQNRSAMVRFNLVGRTSLHAALQKERVVQDMVQYLREEETEAYRHEDSSRPFVWMESLRVQTGMPIAIDELLQQDGFLGDLLRIAHGLFDDEEQLRVFCGEAGQALRSHPKAAAIAAGLSREEQGELLRAAIEMAIGCLYEEEAGA